MIVASPVPGVKQFEAFFFYPLNQLDRTLALLRKIFLAVVVFARAGSHATPLAFSRGFAAATGVAAMLSLAGAGTGLLLPSARGRARRARLALLSSPGEEA